MQSEDLDAEEVVAVGDALRDVEVHPAVVVDEVVDTPDLAAGIKGILEDLEPIYQRDKQRQCRFAPPG